MGIPDEMMAVNNRLKGVNVSPGSRNISDTGAIISQSIVYDLCEIISLCHILARGVWVVVVFAGVLVFAGLLGWQFVGYPLAMGTLALAVGRASDSPSLPSSIPYVTIIVPSYNEVDTIVRRVANLCRQTYPSDCFEVLFVDSGSTDSTPDRLRDALDNLGSDDPSMKLLEETDRNGKASAINLGLDHAQGEIVIVTDANALFIPETVERVISHFTDPEVGAVAGRLAVLNPDKSLTDANQFYRDLEHMKAMGGSLLGSVSQFDGELSAWRVGLARADETSLSEDLDLSVRIRQLGYRIAYAPKAIVSEPEPDTPAEQISSNKRRIIGTIQVLVRYWKYLFLPKDFYRAVVFPSRKTLPMLSPFILIGSAGFVLAAFVAAPWTATGLVVFIAMLGAGAFSALVLIRSRLVEDIDTDRLAAVGDGSGEEASAGEGVSGIRKLLRIANYVAIIEYTILLAWWNFLFRRYSVTWEKSESDRQ